MAADQQQFYQLLDSLLSIDNDVRNEAEVRKFIAEMPMCLCNMENGRV